MEGFLISISQGEIISLLAILWNSVFKWIYHSFSPLPFTSLLFTAISKASSDNHFAFLHFFFWGWSWSLPPVQCHEPPSKVLQALCLSDLIPWIYLSLPLYKGKGFDLGHTWVVYFPGGSEGKASVYNAGDLGLIPGREDSLENEMAIHSSTLAWKIPWMEELGAGYCPWGCKESGTTEWLHFHFLWVV